MFKAIKFSVSETCLRGGKGGGENSPEFEGLCCGLLALTVSLFLPFAPILLLPSFAFVPC